jgi:uncharacterized membrane protein
VGATAGAASCALTDVGIKDSSTKELAASVTPGRLKPFVLVRWATPDKVLEEIKGTGGRVLKTSLSHEDEAKLQAALNAAKTLDWRRETVHGRAAWPRQAFFSIGPISYCGRS